ncbi:unnamed protein product, partial [Coregonus sp. 'balchen']
MFNPSEHLPSYQQYVTCPTQNKACLDLCYGNVPGNYPILGGLDHNMVQLIPVYKPSAAKTVEINSWNPEVTEVLHDCSESTDWAAPTGSADDLEEAADTVSEYIRFCEDLVIPEKKVNIFPNNKPGKEKYSEETQKQNEGVQDTLENLFKDKDSKKAWQGLQTITGYKPKRH